MERRGLSEGLGSAYKTNGFGYWVLEGDGGLTTSRSAGQALGHRPVSPLPDKPSSYHISYQYKEFNTSKSNQYKRSRQYK